MRCSRYINSKPKHERKSAEFVGGIRRKLLCLHEYNLQISKVKFKYPRSEQLDAVLVQYIELECGLLYNSDRKVDEQHENNVKQRILRLLQVILYDALHNSEVPLKTTIKACDKALLKLFANVRADCVSENKLVANVIMKLLDKLKLLEEVNQLKGKNIPYHQDTVLRDPLVCTIRQNLATSDYESDIDNDGDEEGDNMPLGYDDGFTWSTSKLFQPQPLLFYDEPDFLQPSKNCSIFNGRFSQIGKEENEFSSLVYKSNQPMTSNNFCHSRVSCTENGDGDRNRTNLKNLTDKTSPQIVSHSDADELSNSIFQKELCSVQEKTVEPFYRESEAQSASNNYEINTVRSKNSDYNSTFFTKYEDITSSAHPMESSSSETLLMRETCTIQPMAVPVNGNTTEKDDSRDFTAHQSVGFDPQLSMSLQESLHEIPSEIGVSRNKETTNGDLHCLFKEAGICDKINSQPNNSSSVLESLNEIDEEVTTTSNHHLDSTIEVLNTEINSLPNNSTTILESLNKLDKEISASNHQSGSIIETLNVEDILEDQSVNAIDERTTENGSNQPSPALEEFIILETPTAVEEATKNKDQPSTLEVPNTVNLLQNNGLEAAGSTTKNSLPDVVDLELIPDFNFRNSSKIANTTVLSGIITIEIDDDDDDDDETSYTYANHREKEGQSHSTLNNVSGNLLQSNEIKLEENEENHSPNFSIFNSDGNGQNFSGNSKSSRNSGSTGLNKLNNSTNGSVEELETPEIIISDSEDELADVLPEKEEAQADSLPIELETVELEQVIPNEDKEIVSDHVPEEMPNSNLNEQVDLEYEQPEEVQTEDAQNDEKQIESMSTTVLDSKPELEDDEQTVENAINSYTSLEFSSDCSYNNQIEIIPEVVSEVAKEPHNHEIEVISSDEIDLVNEDSVNNTTKNEEPQSCSNIHEPKSQDPVENNEETEVAITAEDQQPLILSEEVCTGVTELTEEVTESVFHDNGEEVSSLSNKPTEEEEEEEARIIEASETSITCGDANFIESSDTISELQTNELLVDQVVETSVICEDADLIYSSVDINESQDEAQIPEVLEAPIEHENRDLVKSSNDLIELENHETKIAENSEIPTIKEDLVESSDNMYKQRNNETEIAEIPETLTPIPCTNVDIAESSDYVDEQRSNEIKASEISELSETIAPSNLVSSSSDINEVQNDEIKAAELPEAPPVYENETIISAADSIHEEHTDEPTSTLSTFEKVDFTSTSVESEESEESKARFMYENMNLMKASDSRNEQQNGFTPAPSTEIVQPENLVVEDKLPEVIDYSRTVQYVTQNSDDVVYQKETTQEYRFPQIYDPNLKVHGVESVHQESLHLSRCREIVPINSETAIMQNVMNSEVMPAEHLAQEVEIESTTVNESFYYKSGLSATLNEVEYVDYGVTKKVGGDLELLANIAADQETLTVKTDSEKEISDVPTDAENLKINELTPKRRKSKVKLESKKKIFARETLPRAVKQFQRKHSPKQKLDSEDSENKRITRNNTNKPKDLILSKHIQKHLRVNRHVDSKYKPHDFISMENPTLPPRTNNVYAQKRLIEANTTSEDSNDSCESTLFIDLSENGKVVEKATKSIYEEETINDMLEFVTTEKTAVCISIPENEESCNVDSFHILKQMEEFVSDTNSRESITKVEEIKVVSEIAVTNDKTENVTDDDHNITEETHAADDDDRIINEETQPLTVVNSSPEQTIEDKTESKIVRPTDHSIENILNKVPPIVELKTTTVNCSNDTIIETAVTPESEESITIEDKKVESEVVVNQTPLATNAQVNDEENSYEISSVPEITVPLDDAVPDQTSLELNTIDKPAANIELNSSGLSEDSSIDNEQSTIDNETEKNCEIQPENLIVKKSDVAVMKNDESCEKIFKTKAAMKAYEDKLHPNPYVLLQNCVETETPPHEGGVRTRARSKSSDVQHNHGSCDRNRSMSVDSNALIVSSDETKDSSELNVSDSIGHNESIDISTSKSDITGDITSEESTIVDNLQKTTEPEEENVLVMNVDNETTIQEIPSDTAEILTTVLENEQNVNDQPKLLEENKQIPIEENVSVEVNIAPIENQADTKPQEVPMLTPEVSEEVIQLDSIEQVVTEQENSQIEKDSIKQVEIVTEIIKNTDVKEIDTNISSPDIISKSLKVSGEEKGKDGSDEIAKSSKASGEEKGKDAPDEIAKSSKASGEEKGKESPDTITKPSKISGEEKEKDSPDKNAKSSKASNEEKGKDSPEKNAKPSKILGEEKGKDSPDKNAKPSKISSEEKGKDSPDKNAKPSKTSGEEKGKALENTIKKMKQKIVESEKAKKERSSVKPTSEDTKNESTLAQGETTVLQQTDALQKNKIDSDSKIPPKTISEDIKEKSSEIRKKERHRHKKSRSRSSSKPRTIDKKPDQDVDKEKSHSRSSSKSRSLDKRHKHHSDAESDRKRRSKSKSVDDKVVQSHEEPNGHRKRRSRSSSKSKSLDEKSKPNSSEKSKHGSSDLTDKQTSADEVKVHHKKRSSKSPSKSKSHEFKTKQSHLEKSSDVDKGKVKDKVEESKTKSNSSKAENKSRTKTDENKPFVEHVDKQANDEKTHKATSKSHRSKSRQSSKSREAKLFELDIKNDEKVNDKDKHSSKSREVKAVEVEIRSDEKLNDKDKQSSKSREVDLKSDEKPNDKNKQSSKSREVKAAELDAKSDEKTAKSRDSKSIEPDVKNDDKDKHRTNHKTKTRDSTKAQSRHHEKSDNEIHKGEEHIRSNKSRRSHSKEKTKVESSTRIEKREKGSSANKDKHDKKSTDHHQERHDNTRNKEKVKECDKKSNEVNEQPAESVIDNKQKENEKKLIEPNNDVSSDVDINKNHDTSKNTSSVQEINIKTDTVPVKDNKEQHITDNKDKSKNQKVDIPKKRKYDFLDENDKSCTKKEKTNDAPKPKILKIDTENAVPLNEKTHPEELKLIEEVEETQVPHKSQEVEPPPIVNLSNDSVAPEIIEKKSQEVEPPPIVNLSNDSVAPEIIEKKSVPAALSEDKLSEVPAAANLTYETFASGIKATNSSVLEHIQRNTATNDAVSSQPDKKGEEVVVDLIATTAVPGEEKEVSRETFESNKMLTDTSELKEISTIEENVKPAAEVAPPVKMLLQNHNLPEALSTDSVYVSSTFIRTTGNLDIQVLSGTTDSIIKDFTVPETNLPIIPSVNPTASIADSVTAKIPASCDVTRSVTMQNTPSCSTSEIQEKTSLFAFNEEGETDNRENLNESDLFDASLGLEDISPTKLPIGSNQSLDLISPSTSIAEISNSMNLVQTLVTSTMNFMNDVPDNAEIDIQQTTKQNSYGSTFVRGPRVTEIRCFVEKESTADHNYTLGDPLLGGNNEDKNILTTGLSFSNAPEEFQLSESHLEELPFNENNFIEENPTLEELGLLLPCKKEKPDFDNIIDDAIPKPEDIQNSIKHLNMLVDISQSGQPKTISVDNSIDHASNSDCSVSLGIDYAVNKLLFLGTGEVTSQNNTYSTIHDIDNINIMESNGSSLHSSKETLDDPINVRSQDEPNMTVCTSYPSFMPTDNNQKVVVEPVEQCTITALDQMKTDYITETTEKIENNKSVTNNKTNVKTSSTYKSSKFATFLQTVKRMDATKSENTKVKDEMENYTIRRHNRTPVFPPKKKTVTQQQHTKTSPPSKKNEILSFETNIADGKQKTAPDPLRTAEATSECRIRVKTDLVKPIESNGHGGLFSQVDYIHENDQNIASEVVLPFSRPSPSEKISLENEKKSESNPKDAGITKSVKHARFDKLGNDYIVENILNAHSESKAQKGLPELKEAEKKHDLVDLSKKRKCNFNDSDVSDSEKNLKRSEKRQRKSDDESDKPRLSSDHLKVRKSHDSTINNKPKISSLESSDDIFDKLVREGPVNKVFAQRISEQSNATVKSESGQTNVTSEMLKNRGYTTVPDNHRKDKIAQSHNTSQFHESARYRDTIRHPHPDSDKRRDQRKPGYYQSNYGAPPERRYADKRHSTVPIANTSPKRYMRNSANSYSSKSDPCTSRDQPYRSRDRRLSTEQLNNLMPNSGKTDGRTSQEDDKFSWIEKFRGSGLFEETPDLFMPPAPGTKREDTSSRK